MEWQPIETAPRDGTPIILSDGLGVWPCSWGPKIKGDEYPWVMFEGTEIYSPPGCCDHAVDERIDVNGWMASAPTHWMPLPPPPGEQP